MFRLLRSIWIIVSLVSLIIHLVVLSIWLPRPSIFLSRNSTRQFIFGSFGICTVCLVVLIVYPTLLILVLDNVRKTAIFFNIDIYRCFFSFFQNISYVKNAFENQFPQLKRTLNSYRFLHFLKNTKNAFKNQFPQVKLNKNLYRILHFLKNKICDIL